MKNNWIKFNNLPKKDKIFRIINILVTICLFMTSCAFFIYYLVDGDIEKRAFICAGCMVVYLLPYLYELIFRRRISNMVLLFFNIYVFLSAFLGSVVNLYQKISWYDIFIHVLAGYTFAVLGLLFASRVTDYNKTSPWKIALICLVFTLTIEYFWEIIEWTIDNIVGITAQGPRVPGYKAPLVTDTMEDLVCNLSGGILFCIQLLIGKLTKFSLGIKFYEGELCSSSKSEVSENNDVVKNQDENMQTEISDEEELKQDENKKTLN